MSYSTNDPRGWCGDPSRGAALGRPTIEGTPEGKITVRLSPLDRQGYDRNGTYFGGGSPLFWYADEGGEVDAVTRAHDMADAIEGIRRRFPDTTIEAGDPLALPCWGAGEGSCPDKADAQEDHDLCESCQLAEVLSDEE